MHGGQFVIIFWRGFKTAKTIKVVGGDDGCADHGFNYLINGNDR
jgi:hypothetical protein